MIDIALLRVIYNHLLNNPGEFEWNRYASIRGVDILKLRLNLQWLKEHGFTENREGRTYRTSRSVGELATAAGSIAIERPEHSQPRRMYERGEISSQPAVKEGQNAEPKKAAKASKKVKRVERVAKAPRATRTRTPREAKPPKPAKPTAPPKVVKVKVPKVMKVKPVKPPKVVKVKVPKVVKVKVPREPKPPKPPKAKCIDRLRVMEWRRLPVWGIADLIRERFSEEYTEGAIVRAMQGMNQGGQSLVQVGRAANESFPRYSKLKQAG
jgi:hypothetical protein